MNTRGGHEYTFKVLTPSWLRGILCWRGGAAVWYADDGDLEEREACTGGFKQKTPEATGRVKRRPWSGLFTSSLISAPWFLLSVRSSMVASRGSVRLSPI